MERVGLSQENYGVLPRKISSFPVGPSILPVLGGCMAVRVVEGQIPSHADKKEAENILTQ